MSKSELQSRGVVSSVEEHVDSRFGLGQACVLMFLLNIILYCGTWFGFQDPEYLFSILLATFAGMLIVVAYQNDQPMLAMVLVAGACIMAFQLKLFPLFVGPVVVGLAGRYLGRRKLSGMQMANYAIMGTAIGLLTQVAIPYEPADPYLRELRKSTPVRSLTQRLAYQDRSRSNSEIRLSDAVIENLGRQERMMDRLRLVDSSPWGEAAWIRDLRSAHAREIKRFHRAQGFGFRRMTTDLDSAGVSPEIQDEEYLTFDSPGFSKMNSSDWNERIVKDQRPSGNRFWLTDNVHQLHQLDFLDPSFGWVDSKSRVAGFQPHGFTDFDSGFYDGVNQWKLKQLQLVSLDRYPEPRAYVLDHMPRMDELSEDEVKTRGLNSFERKSLKRLEQETDVIIDPNSSGAELRMIGAIRAVSNCLPCHDHVQRGELLGAFTYRFETKYQTKSVKFQK